MILFHKRVEKIALTLFVSSLLCLLPLCLNAQDSKSAKQRGTPDYNLGLVLELDKTLHEFAQKHGIKEQDESTFIGQLMIERPSISKGGVGIIASDEYVFPEDKKNGVKINGRTWTGKDWSEGEIVVTDSEHILASVSGKDLSTVDPSTLKIVIFTPKQIHYLDLSLGKGGFYERHPKYEGEVHPTGLWPRNSVFSSILVGGVCSVFIRGLWRKRRVIVKS